MSEHHLSEILVNCSAALLGKHRKLDVFKRESLHPSAKASLRHDRHERRAKLGNRMPERSCEPVSVTVRACQGIGSSARSDDNRVELSLSAAISDKLFTLVVYLNSKHLAEHKFHSCLLTLVKHRRDDVRRLIRNGKNTVSSLDLQGHSRILKELLCVLLRMLTECGV